MVVGIDFSILSVSWKDCSGYSDHFASKRIENFVAIPPAGFNTRTATPFVSPLLAESLFYEARHYSDRALYHLIVGKWMACNKRPTWGMVSYYYSAFFSAQAAIRLAGTFFVKLNYESETQSMPTHRLDVVNLLKHQFQIRQASREGEHQRVWKTFYDRFGYISNRPGWARFQPITAIIGEEERLSEMHRRHLLNYVPGFGYTEVISPRDAAVWCKQLAADLPSDLATNIDHEDFQMEVRALLRLELCMQWFQKIADEGGTYSRNHRAINMARRGWLSTFECPTTLATRLESVLPV